MWCGWRLLVPGQWALPFVDLRGMQIELLAELGHGLVLAQRGQHHLGLERCTVEAARAPPGGFLVHRKLFLAGPPGASSMHGACFISPVQIFGASYMCPQNRVRSSIDTGATACSILRHPLYRAFPMARQTNDESREISTKRLATAGARLFSKNGYRNTSVEQIAAASRLTKGAVYYYFRNKEQLLIHILNSIEHERIDSLISHLWEHDLSASARLAALANLQTTLGKEHPDDLMLLVMMSIEFTNTKTVIKKKVDAIYSKMIAAFQRIIEEGKARGEFESPMATDEIATIFMSTHDGNLIQWYRSGRDAEVGHMLARAYRRVLLQTVGSRERY